MASEPLACVQQVQCGDTLVERVIEEKIDQFYGWVEKHPGKRGQVSGTYQPPSLDKIPLLSMAGLLLNSSMWDRCLSSSTSPNLAVANGNPLYPCRFFDPGKDTCGEENQRLNHLYGNILAGIALLFSISQYCP